MRNLGTLILLSAAAFAQTPTAVQTPVAPATVSVQSATPRTPQTTKPSPNGVKASATSAVPKAKPAVSVKRVPMTKPATLVQKAGSVKPVVAGRKNTISAGAKSASTTPAQNAVSVKAPVPKSASLDPKQKVIPQASTASKAVPAKSAPTVGVLVKPTTVPVVKGASQPTALVKAGSAGPKPAVAHVMANAPGTKTVAVKPVARVKAAAKTKVVAGAKVQENKPTAQTKQVPTEIRTAGRRDPFLSPVVAMGAIGSGCSAGKRCLTIDQIALKGVVKSESGMIAVVTNSLDKAYFLRENDPVFNGYVVKITGDSIIFKETFHDRLGKALTRDVTKSITRPVA
jgi:Tfp pilus assembly protein PilP